MATGISEERIRGWGFVQAVLSAVWSLDEDPVPDRHVLAVAERITTGAGGRVQTHLPHKPTSSMRRPDAGHLPRQRS
ncbi:MAG: hypothetical protein ACRDRW_17130 [Pseudonocardiaceae bacterium]